jgi:hypothetical protein
MAASMLAADDALPEPPDLDFSRIIPKTLPRSAAFTQPGWHLWDPCVVKGEDGAYHLFYSRWKSSLGFDAWCTHAEIAWATATTITGPYVYRGVALPQRGGKFWAGH